jgi:hypothetical protein
MLQNIDKYESMMPGFREQAEAIASDPVKWKEAMTQAKAQIEALKKHRDSTKNTNLGGGSGNSFTPDSNAIDDLEADSLDDEN